MVNDTRFHKVYMAIASIIILLLVYENQKLKRIIGHELLPTDIGLDQIHKIDSSQAPMLGDPNAPVKILVFSDFTCDSCRQASHSLEALRLENPGEIVVYYMHLHNPQNEESRIAAMSSIAAHRQGMFWEMHDLLLYSNEKNTPERINQYAATLDLDLDQFQQDLRDPNLKERLERDLTQASNLSIYSTPTLFINGLRVSTAEKAKIKQAIQLVHPKFAK